MSFDDEVDEVKKEMMTAKLDPAARKEAAAKLLGQLKQNIASKRLDFVSKDEDGEPTIQIKYKKEDDLLATVFVNEDGSITFQAAGASDEADDEDDDAGYFPSYVEYMDADEFLEEAYDMLKVGVAEYELDREQRAA